MSAAPESLQQQLDLLADGLSAAQPVPTDPGAAFYRRSAQTRRLFFVDHVFPAFREGLESAQRCAFDRAYLSEAPGTDPIWIHNARAVLEVVAARVTAGELPAATADAVWHAWRRFVIAQDLPAEPGSDAGEAVGEALAGQRLGDAAQPYVLNRSLRMAGYAHDVTQPLRLGQLPESPMQLMYLRHPERPRVMVLPLSPQRLAWLRAASEQLSLVQLAELSGLSHEAMQRAAEEAVAEGLLEAVPSP